MPSNAVTRGLTRVATSWQRITRAQPRYLGYERKTDRAIPVIRLTRAD